MHEPNVVKGSVNKIRPHNALSCQEYKESIKEYRKVIFKS